MRKALTGLVVLAFCFVSLGCMDTGAQRGAGIGGISGGVIGGVIGHQSGRIAEGVAIGAVSGALLGGLIGHDSEKRATPAQSARVIAICPNGHQVDVTGFPAGSDVRCPVCNSVFRI